MWGRSVFAGANLPDLFFLPITGREELTVSSGKPSKVHGGRVKESTKHPVFDTVGVLKVGALILFDTAGVLNRQSLTRQAGD